MIRKGLRRVSDNPSVLFSTAMIIWDDKLTVTGCAAKPESRIINTKQQKHHSLLFKTVVLSSIHISTSLNVTLVYSKMEGVWGML